MLWKLIVTVFFVGFVTGFTYDDFTNDVSKEVIEDGKNQYQLLQERGRLPKYGSCWISAVEHINEGCRYLSEDIQSDIALRITNCFLEMSGHETYNCDRDKKPNLRGICINSMTDRAFNVYTEFYTHAQNICWFLRGQIWQEKISIRTKQVGEQLQTSVVQQELLLQQQRTSLTMQEQLLNYGKNLERVLNESRTQVEYIMEEMKVSTIKHQELLTLMSSSLNGLQSWLIGEISWFDSIVFYIAAAIITLVITSSVRLASARLPLLFTLSMNIVLERTICNYMFNYNHIEKTQILYKYIWWSRNFTLCICILIIFIQWYFYHDYLAQNHSLLLKIYTQNTSIKEELNKLKLDSTIEPEVIKTNNCCKTVENNNISPTSTSPDLKYNSRYIHARSSVSLHREILDSFQRKVHNWSYDENESSNGSTHRYNLRKRNESND